MTVDAGKNITILGSGVNNSGIIKAPSGEVSLIALSEQGLINLDAAGKVSNFDLSEASSEGTVTNDGVIDVFGETGGNIKILGNHVELNEDTLINVGGNEDSENPANFTLQAANDILLNNFDINANNDLLNVILNAGNDIRINNGEVETNGGEFRADAGGLFALQGAVISNNNLSSNGAPININANSVEMQQADILGKTTTTGRTGNVNITAVESIELLGNSNIDNNTEGSGNTGDINVKTDRLLLQNDSDINGLGTGSGTLGTINVETGTFDIKNQSGIGSNTLGAGNAGKINIKSNTLEIENQSGLGTDSGADDNGNRIDGLKTTGNAGEINIVADKIAIRANSGMGSKTFGSGDAGKIIINTGSLVINNSGFGVETGVDNKNDTPIATGNTGNGGSVEINADFISLSESGITSETGGKSDAGTIKITANSLIVDNYSSLKSNTFSSGRGGNIKLQINKDLAVNNQSSISVSSLVAENMKDTNNRLGDAGNISIQARKIEINNQGSLFAETVSGKGGEINLQLQDFLLLRRKSAISTTAGSAGRGDDGGNIRIQSPFIIAVPLENSDITANAFNGSGGNVEVSAEGILGLTPRTRDDLVNLLDTDDPSQLDPEKIPSNDITAISQASPALEGILAINSTDNSNIQNSLTELPQSLIDTDVLIANSCVVRSEQQNGTFFITGKAGFPSSPGDPVSSVYSTIEVQPLPDDTSSMQSRSRWKIGDPIIEATGIYRLKNGQRILGRECEK